ncbi:unnamed protein product, partial [Meganyctiphanes norvegica]
MPIKYEIDVHELPASGQSGEIRVKEMVDFQKKQVMDHIWTNTDLIKHTRILNIEKPYQCNLCDKAFTKKNIFKTHQWIHTGEKPYQCKQCDKIFSRNNILVRHQRIHTG